MKCQQKPASFINKLYSILKSKQHSKAIIWDSELKGIRILNQKKLQQTVLPRYYRHNRFASFVRQLNMYDFHKIHLGDHKSIFCHEHFDPRKKQTIYIVKRKVTFNLDTNSQKNSSYQDKQIHSIHDNDNDINKLQNPSNKQNKQNSFSDRSFKLFKDSIKIINERKSQRICQDNIKKEEQILQQLVSKILSLNLNNEEVKKKILQYRKDKNYRKYLRKKCFKQNLFQRLGIQFDNQDDKLSQLSIQGQLLIQTRKTFTQKSLRLFESGPIVMKDSIGNLMSFQI